MTGRANQKARTRQAIVRAAGAMLARGEKPTLDDVAAEARVSRATTYRYFPGLDALLNEAAVDLLMPEPDELFAVHPASDPFERLERVDEVKRTISGGKAGKKPAEGDAKPAGKKDTDGDFSDDAPTKGKKKTDPMDDEGGEKKTEKKGKKKAGDTDDF